MRHKILVTIVLWIGTLLAVRVEPFNDGLPFLLAAVVVGYVTRRIWQNEIDKFMEDGLK